MAQPRSEQTLSRYISFLKEQNTDELAGKQENYLRGLLFTEEKISPEILELIKIGLEILFSDLVNNQDYKQTINFLIDNKTKLSKVIGHQQGTDSLILSFLIALKQLIFSYLPEYSNDVPENIKIVLALEKIFYWIQSSLILHGNEVENKLKESQKQLSLIYNSTSDLMLLISVEKVEEKFVFRFLSANKSYLNVLKFYNIETSEQEMAGRTIEDITINDYKLTTEMSDFVNMKYTEAASSQAPITYEEFIDLPGAGKFYSETTLTPIFNDMGSCTNLLFVSRDINNRKLAEEEIARQKMELKNSNEELQKFAYVASHDLQEPLRMVTSFVQLLEKKYKNSLDENALEYIGFMVDGVKRMQALIQGLLEYSRISTRSYNYLPTDFNKVLESVKANLLLLIEDNEAEIKYENLPTINADENQMVRLIQNIVSNAIKYHSAEKTLIKISARQKENQWVFAIKDNGIGINKDYFERIFDIFKRLHTREIYPGEGLGLAICKKIIERHYGTIWVKSEEGKGATFFFTLPASIAG